MADASSYDPPVTKSSKTTKLPTKKTPSFEREPFLLTVALAARRRAELTESPDDIAIADVFDAVWFAARLAARDGDAKQLQALATTSRDLLRERDQNEPGGRWYGHRLHVADPAREDRTAAVHRLHKYAKNVHRLFVAIETKEATHVLEGGQLVPKERAMPIEERAHYAASLVDYVSKYGLAPPKNTGLDARARLTKRIRDALTRDRPPPPETLTSWALQACGVTAPEARDMTRTLFPPAMRTR